VQEGVLEFSLLSTLAALTREERKKKIYVDKMMNKMLNLTLNHEASNLFFICPLQKEERSQKG
jgi:hypothetical protein